VTEALGIGVHVTPAAGAAVLLAAVAALWGMLRSEAFTRRSARVLGRLAAAGLCCAQVPAWMATRSFIRRAHGLGLPVHVWTVNDRTEMTCLLDLDADGIMTDETVLLRDVLAARGQWRPIRRQGAAV